MCPNIHIALVIQDLYTRGAQYVTALVARGLIERGYEVDIVVSAVHSRIATERPQLTPFPIPDKARIVQLPNLKSSQNILQLMRYFKTCKPNVVIPMSSNYEPACAIASCFLSRSIRPKLMPVVHSGTIGVPQAQMFFSGFRENLLRRWISRFSDTRMDKVLAVSKGVADALVLTGRFPREKVSVVYNPVVDETFIKKRDSPATHPWLINKTCPVLVTAGAHESLKGYDILLRAFAEVKRKMSCRLVLFGEGTQTQNLQELAETLGVIDDTSFPGYTDNLPANLKHADLFVLSSHFESFSIVLVEALACGIPVVATNCPSGPPEILLKGRYGILVEPNNSTDLAKGICNALCGHGIIPPPESWLPYSLQAVIERYDLAIHSVCEF